MFKKYTSIIFGSIMFLLLALPVDASSSNNKNFATLSWVEEQFEQLNITVINNGITNLETSYQNLVTRLDNIELQLTSLFSKDTQQDEYDAQLEGRLTNLETRVIVLEALHPVAPENKTIVFADNRPQPFNSVWKETTGYNNIVIDVSSSNWISQYAVHYTNDPATATDHTGFVEQTRVGCSGSTCPTRTLPVLGNYYRISTGTASGNITATGWLSN